MGHVVHQKWFEWNIIYCGIVSQLMKCFDRYSRTPDKESISIARKNL